MSAQSVTGICNRALQLVGSAQRITNLTDNTREARALDRAYDPCRREELRVHPWNFAIKRAQLAADAAVPAFGPTAQFSLPADCLRVIMPSGAGSDWQLEGRKILVSSTAPFDLRYVSDEEDPTVFDAAFCEVLAARIALAIVEDLTQSTAKQEVLQATYTALYNRAKKTDAIENLPQPADDPSWVTDRYTGTYVVGKTY